MAPAASSGSPPPASPLRLLRWHGRTEAVVEELGEGQQLTMVRIPAGRFTMGSPQTEAGRTEDEGPVREVVLGEFLMAQTPVTQAQWQVVAQWQPRQGERWGRELDPFPSRFSGGRSNARPLRIFLSCAPELRHYPTPNQSYLAWAELALSSAGATPVVEPDRPEGEPSDARTLRELKRVMGGCDGFVGIYGFRYGTDGRDGPRISPQELEFDAASEAGIPRLIFIAASEARIPQLLSTMDEQSTALRMPPQAVVDDDKRGRQKAFLSRLAESGVAFQQYKDPEHLASLLLASLKHLEVQATLHRGGNAKGDNGSAGNAKGDDGSAGNAKGDHGGAANAKGDNSGGGNSGNSDDGGGGNSGNSGGSGDLDSGSPSSGDSPQLPVEGVNWAEAMEFCDRLRQRTGRNYALPSEAQWEYACRAGTTTPYAFGVALPTHLANHRPLTAPDGATSGEASAVDRQRTTAVGMFPANAWGLQDMHGNVWEWCLDHWHPTYAGAPVDGGAWLEPQATGNADRVLRGGAWSDPPTDARSACRYRLPPAVAPQGIVGLRVVCLPPA